MQIFDKVYELPLSRDYVAHWGAPEAVREIIQNAIDSNAPLVWQFGSNSLTVSSEGVRLPPSTLLLGSTSKARDESKIGSFGEGFKIAMLVLARNGVEVEVLNDDVTWVPSFKHSRMFDAEVLSIRETANKANRGGGLTFNISNLSEADIMKIVENTLQMQGQGEVIDTKYGQILKDKPGMLYVSGLFVCETELKYGYNVKPQYLRLERDRKTVDGFDLKLIAKNMHFDTGLWDEICADMEAEIPDLEYADWDAPEVLKETCYAHFIEKNEGQDIPVVSSQQELREHIAAGLKETVYVGGSYGKAIRSAPSYEAKKEFKPKPKTPPHVDMASWLSANRSNMRAPAIIAFKELIEKSREWSNK